MALLLNQLSALDKAKSGTMQFDVVMKMITKMTGILEAEQAGDEKHKAHCEKEFANSAKEQEANKVAIDAVTSTISDLGDQVSLIAGDIATIEEEIKALDVSVASATIQRKNEHAEHTEFVTLNQAALQLIEKARQRLYKFYNPVLYKPPPKKELTMEEKIYSAAGRSEFNSPPPEAAYIAGTSQLAHDSGYAAASSLAQIRSHRILRAAPPPPPPETFGAYSKNDEKSTGVLGLMDMLVKELEGDMETASTDEAAAQKDYETLMSESAATRAQDAKSITDKEKSKAELETKMEAAKESKALSIEEQAQIASVIYELHGACDFLLENFDMRKEARTSELESLKNSKSVLSGANFSG
jgi:septal ring factor EnvC (AmiA/AmiB activator)